MDGDQTVTVYQNGAVRYWNILANGVVGWRDAAGNKFYYLKDHPSAGSGQAWAAPGRW